MGLPVRSISSQPEYGVSYLCIVGEGISFFFYISPFFVLYMEMIAAIRVALVRARCQSLVFFGIGTKDPLGSN